MKVQRLVEVLSCLVGLVGCTAEHHAANAVTACMDGAECSCSGPQHGSQVCDLLSHELVMCDCPTPRGQPSLDDDAGGSGTVADSKGADAAVAKSGGAAATAAGPGHADEAGSSAAAHGGAPAAERAGAGGDSVGADAGIVHPGKGMQKGPKAGHGGH
jgi:hypothetical protein